MKRHIIAVLALCVGFSSLAEDGFTTDLSHGWRLTVGPQFNFNAKGHLGVKSGAIPVPAPRYLSTKAAAKSAGDGVRIGSGRTELGNGAFIDTEDAAGVARETWNWYVPAGTLENGSMTISNPYYERSTTYSAVGGYDNDNAHSTGLSIGIERDIWRCGRFGVEGGFNFTFFRKNNWFRGTVGGYSRTDVYTEGSYNAEVNLGNSDVLNDPWAQNADGSFGVGTFDGPGPVLSLDDISISRGWGREVRRVASSSYGAFDVHGDLQIYEFQLALKPYYELTDWFMVRGTLGVGLDYRRIDVRVSDLGKGSDDDWDCYAICGLGGLVHWNGVCIGGDFLRKVFDDGMDVNTRYVNGTIDNANWMLRVYLGWEF